MELNHLLLPAPVINQVHLYWAVLSYSLNVLLNLCEAHTILKHRDLSAGAGTTAIKNRARLYLMGTMEATDHLGLMQANPSSLPVPHTQT